MAALRRWQALRLPQQEAETWWDPRQVEQVGLRGLRPEVCGRAPQAAPHSGKVEAPLHSRALRRRRVQQGAVVGEVLGHLQQRVQGEADLHAGAKQLLLLVSARQEREELLAPPPQRTSPPLAWMGQQVLHGGLRLQAQEQWGVVQSQVQGLEAELLWPAQVEVRRALLYREQLWAGLLPPPEEAQREGGEQESAPHRHLLPEKP